MTFTVVIPARYASTRLPAKPLADIGGKPMVQHVWERASSSSASRVLVATDDQRIVDACESFGAEVLLTATTHPSGTDRLAEVASRLKLAEEEIVVNVQGDEPLIPAAVIDQVAANLARHQAASIATLCEEIVQESSLLDPNVVKVVTDAQGFALYFSRAPIPFPRDREFGAGAALDRGQWWRHLGIYAYRTGFLHRYTAWAPAPVETCESLEQLRALYQGEKIHVAPSCAEVPGGIDTEDDLVRIRQALKDARTT